MERFLGDLFGDEVTPERRIAVFTTPDQQTRFFSDLGLLGMYARLRQGTQNVYFGVGLIRGDPVGRGKYEDVAAIGALWCDIDIHSPAHPRENLPQSLEDAQGLLQRMPLKASLVIHSGHGLHAYWLLHEPWVFESDRDRSQAASLAKRWHGRVCALAAQKGWALENLGDLTRVLRLPSTLNHRGTEKPAPVQILESDPRRRYAPDDFEPFLPDEQAAACPQTTVTGPLVLRPDAEPPASKLLETAGQSPLFWNTWRRERPDLADQSQSGYDLSLATIAMLNGWSDQEVADLVIAARRHHGEKPEKALREDYIRRTLAKARQASTLESPDAEQVDLSKIIGLQEEEEEDPGKPEYVGSFPIGLIDRTPDIVKRCMDYYYQNAIEMQPVLFLASLIAATGTVLGHKVKDASGLRANIYTLGILSTGAGKEMTRECVFRIFQHAGIGPWCGHEDLGSDAGLVSAVELQNPILFQIDEFGRFMHALNVGGARQPHLYNIASALLRLYSKAGSVYRSKAYADAKRNREIPQPHVCLYGTTVSKNFWRAMNAESIDGGFLPRLVIFETLEDPLPGEETETDPPPDVVEFFALWANRRITPGNLERVHPQPLVVPYTPQAKGMMKDLRVYQNQERKRLGDLGPIWTRARENAGKLAMIYACWKDRDNPVIDEQAAQWAIDVILHAVRHTVYEANLCIADGAFHERCQLIMQAVARAPGRRLSRRALTRATRNMTPREREDAISTLYEQGRLKTWTEPSGGRPTAWYGAR